jgi:hypothetical protein
MAIECLVMFGAEHQTACREMSLSRILAPGFKPPEACRMCPLGLATA